MKSKVMGAKWLGPLAILVALPAMTSAQAWKMPRTPDGRPDLQGIWTNASNKAVGRMLMFTDGRKLFLSETQPGRQ